MDIQEILQSANDIYKQVYKRSSVDVPKFNDERMELTTDKKFSGDELRIKLNYYASWIAYYNQEYMRWKFIRDWLEDQVKEQNAKLMIQKGKPAHGQGKRVEAEIELELQPFRKAANIAGLKMSSAYNDLSTATQQRDNISRQITLMQIEYSTTNRE